ncbi:MAG: hypothetical protein AAGJ37_01885 [Pseudomonadota bacterium]
MPIKTLLDHRNTVLNDEWDGLIGASNAALFSGHFKRAIIFSIKALAVAESNFAILPVSKSTVTAVLVSYNNVADLYVKTGQLCNARRYLKSAVACFEQFSLEQFSIERRNTRELKAEQREAVSWGKTKATEQLWLFQKQHCH